MDKAEIRAWMKRWEVVNDFEIEESRAKTPDQRLNELDALFAFGSEPPSAEDEAALENIRAQWARLKVRAHGR